MGNKHSEHAARRATDADLYREDSTSSMMTPRLGSARRWSISNQSSTSPLAPKTPRIKIFGTDFGEQLASTPDIPDEVRIVLMGTSGSGKSTFYKHVKQIARGRFDIFERRRYRDKIFRSVVRNMRAMVEAAMLLHDPVNPFTKANKERAKHILGIDNDAIKNVSGVWTDILLYDIEALWRDEAIQNAFLHRGTKYDLDESIPYFFNNLYRFHDSEYVPTDVDVIMFRRKTKKFDEFKFEQDKLRVTITDTGGSRDQRKKWRNCFRGTTAIVYFASLQDYARKTETEDMKNRLEDSLFTLSTIVNKPVMRRVPVVLVLSQSDMFAETLERTPLGEVFPYFDGGNDPQQAINYMKDNFIRQYHGDVQNKIIPVILDCTNTVDVKKVLETILLASARQKKLENIIWQNPSTPKPVRSWKLGKEKMLQNKIWLDIEIDCYHGTYEQCVQLRQRKEEETQMWIQYERRKLIQRIEEKRMLESPQKFENDTNFEIKV